MPLSATIEANVKATLTSPVDLSSPQDVLTYLGRATLANGTAAGQADQLWHDQRTTTESGEDLDLATGLTNALGQSVNLARAKGLVIKADEGNAVDLVCGPASVNGWQGPFGDASDRITVQPGGAFLMWATGATAWPVTAGTGDLLHVAAASVGSVTYDVIVIGATA